MKRKIQQIPQFTGPPDSMETLTRWLAQIRGLSMKRKDFLELVERPLAQLAKWADELPPDWPDAVVVDHTMLTARFSFPAGILRDAKEAIAALHGNIDTRSFDEE